MTAADIGLIGLGVMGANLALNMAEKGHRVAVYNRTSARTASFIASAGDLERNLVSCGSLGEMVGLIRPPRPIVLMIKAGPAVDEQAVILGPNLSRGDIVIDTGNANFRDTQRRCREWAAHGIDFLGVGVSGGEEGARHGPSIMAGGATEAWERVALLFNDIAARYDGLPCSARVGPDGAGHFVKTIHNGIEYADMQMIAEIYGVMRDGLGFTPDQMADAFESWNEGPLKSYLIEITTRVLRTEDPNTRTPLITLIVDKAGQKGTGRWAAIEAQDLGTPATVIEAAVAARNWAARKEERLAGEAQFGAAPRRLKNSFGTDAEIRDILHQAMVAGRIVAYAQGFEVMAAASAYWNWSLPLKTIAQIWRAGCIIRSAFLDDIAQVYGLSDVRGNLMNAPFFAEMMKKSEGGLRGLVAQGTQSGLPLPALSAALANFDYMRAGRSTADLIQGQRDYFGAHGFERTDGLGATTHGPWSDSKGS